MEEYARSTFDQMVRFGLTSVHDAAAEGGMRRVLRR
jgi:hypothetical protein